MKIWRMVSFGGLLDFVEGSVNLTIRASKAARGGGRTLGGLVIFALSAFPFSLVRTAFMGPVTGASYGVALLAACAGIGIAYIGFYHFSHGVLTVLEAFEKNRHDLSNARPVHGKARNATLDQRRRAAAGRNDSGAEDQEFFR